MDRRRDGPRDDYRRDNRGDLRDSLTTRNVSLAEKQAERQVVRIERRDLRNEQPVSSGSDNNDWKADRDKFASTLVNEGVVRDYGKRDDRGNGRNFPANDANHLRPHHDFKNQQQHQQHRDGPGNNSNFRGRGGPDNNTDSLGRPLLNNRKPIPPLKPIDRKKRCPFLMRVFLSPNQHNEIASFQNGSVPKEELAIYTWPDAKLKEVAQLIKENYPDADKADSTLKFSRVFPDPKTGDMTIAEIGKSGSRIGNDDYQNIHDLGFSIGDYMDVAILTRKF
jgi:hypothetical protein